MFLTNIEKRRDNNSWIVEFQTEHQGELCFITGGENEQDAIIQALKLAIGKYDELLDLNVFDKFKNIDNEIYEYIKLRCS